VAANAASPSGLASAGSFVQVTPLCAGKLGADGKRSTAHCSSAGALQTQSARRGRESQSFSARRSAAFGHSVSVSTSFGAHAVQQVRPTLLTTL
jgi:hypothetical protein